MFSQRLLWKKILIENACEDEIKKTETREKEST